ncbi:MAG: ABC transporter substrate-binding protein [Armatimonadota bacterium]
MIRLLTLGALALLILRLLLTGNAPAAAPGGGREIHLEMSVWGMPWENDLYTKVYIPEFERQNPGFRVRFHHFEDYNSRILLSHAGGIAPDVIRLNIESTMGWFRRGLNLPLDRFIDGPDGVDRSDFIPILWESLKYNGETYGIPQDINIQGLYFNKDLFDEAGIFYPDSTWTWKQLHDAAKKLTKDRDGDGHADVVGIDFAWGAATFRPFVYQAGGKFWSEDGERSTLDSPEAAEALSFYRSLMQSYTLTRTNSQRGGLGPDKFFEAGKVAMYIDGSWRTPSLKKNAPRLRFGVAPVPRGKHASSVSTSCYWALSRDTKHPEAAWKLAKFLSSKEALEKYWQFLWVAPPARWSALRSPKFREVTGAEGKIPGIDTAEEFEEKCGWIPQVLEQGWTTVEFCNPYSDRMMLHLQEAVDRALLEKVDPAVALRTAAEKINTEIAKMKRSEAIARGETPPGEAPEGEAQ